VLVSWHKYESEIMKKVWEEGQKSNQYLDYMRQQEDKAAAIRGDPANIQTGLTAPTPSTLSLKLYEDIESDSQKEMNEAGKTTELDAETEKKLRMKKMSIDLLIAATDDNEAKRRALIARLDNAVTRLGVAKTDAEVKKINAEINAIHTSMTALSGEIADQERTASLVQSKSEAEEIRNELIKEAALNKKNQEQITKNNDYLKSEKIKHAANPDDKNNIYWRPDFGKVIKSMAENDKNGNYGKISSDAKNAISAPEKGKEVPLVYVSEYHNVKTDADVQGLRDMVEPEMKVIDDRKK